VAPHDVLTVSNCSQEEPVDVTVDGRPVCLLPAGEEIKVRFVGARSHLAQIAGSSFYRRLQEKFGRLAAVP
jgi:NAD+ kinase